MTHRPSAEKSGQRSLMTPLGVMAGEVLTYLEQRGPTSLRRLCRELGRPAALVMMAAGALIREGLVSGIQREPDVILQPQACRSAA